MMKLKTIKSKNGNKEYNELILNTIKLIKSNLNIPDNEYLFFLAWFRYRVIFLYNDTVIITYPEFDYGNDKRPVFDSVRLTELYTVKLLKYYPKTPSDIVIKTIIKGKDEWMNAQIFLNEIDEPSDINEKIDEPLYKVISFLQNYNRKTFSTERYNFYSKWDNDSNFILNIYAYDKKNNVELKLYIPDKCEKVNDEWEYLEPTSVNDIAVDDFANNISNYQKLQCKKAFLKLANEENNYFKVKNFWVMELTKLTIQPVDILHEWSCHRCFCKINLFGKNKGAIWVQDFIGYNEESYFFITDSAYLFDTTKIATLNFKNPKYHENGIYKRGNVKRKGWKLNKKEINDLMKFLMQKSDRIESEYYKDSYDKYVKTNWQQLIFEYNHNTAGWGWGENDFNIPPEKDDSCYNEALPFDLPIPDYTKLR